MPSRVESVYIPVLIGLSAICACLFLALVVAAFLAPQETLLSQLLMAGGFVVSVVLSAMLLGLQSQMNAMRDALGKAQARAAREAREAQARADFLGKISHELRTPLNAMIGYADVLTQRMFGPLGNPRYEEYAFNIRQGGETLLNIV